MTLLERLFGDRGPRPLHSVQSNMQAGVFVSIHEVSSGENALRGCVGFPLPRGELYSSLEELAALLLHRIPDLDPFRRKSLVK